MSIGANRLKRIIALGMALLLLLLAAGCGSPAGGKPADSKPGGSEVSDSPRDSGSPKKDEPGTDAGDDDADWGGYPTATDGTPSSSYLAFTQAKGELVSLITDALASKPEMVFESMNLLGAVMVDLLVMPAGFMGLGEIAAASGLGLIGGTDIEYSENGNQYTISYKDSEGNTTKFVGTYDAAADALVCEVTSDGEGVIYYEYSRTPFGYVAQVYTVSEDNETELVQINIHENGGVLGFSTMTDKPASLTGKESKDFAKDCSLWYSINGTAVTSVTSDGSEFEFEYIPQPEE